MPGVRRQRPARSVSWRIGRATMSDLRVFSGPNAGYVLELYDRYLEDPTSVDPDLRAFFADFTPTLPSTNGATKTATAVAEPAVRTVAEPSSAADIAKIVGAASLAIGVREYGHLAAQIDPLGSTP